MYIITSEIIARIRLQTILTLSIIAIPKTKIYEINTNNVTIHITLRFKLLL